MKKAYYQKHREKLKARQREYYYNVLKKSPAKWAQMLAGERIRKQRIKRQSDNHDNLILLLKQIARVAKNCCVSESLATRIGHAIKTNNAALNDR